MKSAFRPVLATLFLSQTLLLAQAPQEVDAKIAAITGLFQAAYDRNVGTPHSQALLDLDTRYQAAVARALSAAAQQGNLEEALKLREEAKRLTNKGALPPVDLDSLPASLKQLRATYRGALEKLEADRDAKSQPFYDHYDKLLEALQTDLTKQQRIDDALAVKSKRESIALDRPKVALAAPAADTIPSAPGSAPPATAAAFKGSPWRAAAEWTLSLRGSVEIVEDNRRQTVTDIAKLPAGKFDIIRISFSRYSQHDGFKMNETDLALLNPLLRTLEYLDLDDCNITGPGLEAIAGAAKLRTLSLHRCPLTDDAIKHLSALPNLEKLILGTAAMTGSGLAHLRGLPKLQRLELANWGLKGASGRTFNEAGSQALGSLLQLQELAAHGSNLGAPEVKLTDGVGKLVNLRKLSIGDGTTLNDAALAALSGLTKLESVSFDNSQVSGSGVVHLKASAATLTAVTFWYGCPVTDQTVQTIAATLPNLDRLSIGYGGPCGVNSLTALTSLKKLQRLYWASKIPLADADTAQFALMPELTELTLEQTPLTDTGIAGIALCKKLSTLNLNTQVTDACLPHLQTLKPLRKLRLSRNTEITEAGIASFKKARPDVTVER